MANAQHSANTGEWYTPPRWTGCSARALGGVIDYDPCSSALANLIVGAELFHGAADNSLMLRWHEFARSGFVNPPGTCEIHGTFPGCGDTMKSGKPRTKCSCALPREFLARSIIEAYHGMDIVYLAYSVNQLRQLSKMKAPAQVEISIALPEDRIPYVDPATMEPVTGTNCDSAFVCLSKDVMRHQRFAHEFRAEGCEVYRRAPEVQTCS